MTTSLSLSPKAVFYLQHREQIEEWTKLARNVSDDVHEWLASWAPSMDSDPPEAELNLYARTEDTGWPKLLWYRDAWAGAREGGRPKVGIGVEWRFKSRSHDIPNPYYGIWIDRKREPEREHEELQRRLEGRVSDASISGSSRKSWPLEIDLDPLSESFDPGGGESVYEEERIVKALEDYREQALSCVRDLWEEVADDVDEVMRTVENG